MSIRRRDWLQPLKVMSIGITNNDKDRLIINWLYPSRRVKETFIKWIYGKRHKHKNCLYYCKYETHKTCGKNTPFSLPEVAESFPNINWDTLGTIQVCSSSASVWDNQSQGYKLSEMAAIRDFRLSTNKKHHNQIQPQPIRLNRHEYEYWKRGLEPPFQNLDLDLTRYRNKQSTTNATNRKYKTRN